MQPCAFAKCVGIKLIFFYVFDSGKGGNGVAASSKPGGGLQTNDLVRK